MPRINDTFLQTVVYLYPSPEAAHQGHKTGGTGFIVSYKLKNTNKILYYVVTNAHVAEKMSAPGAARFNTKENDTTILNVFSSDWLLHPKKNDIAIVALNNPSDTLKHASIDVSMFLTENFIQEYDIGLGSDTCMIGRFIQHNGTKTNTPINSCGTISMMPLEPIILNSGISQEGFLIQSQSFSGFSGSPVLVRTNQPLLGGDKTKHTWLLLGINCAHINIYEPLQEKNGDTLKQTQNNKMISTSNSGHMVVIPAWKIYEMFTSDPIAQHIKNLESQP